MGIDHDSSIGQFFLFFIFSAFNIKMWENLEWSPFYLPFSPLQPHKSQRKTKNSNLSVIVFNKIYNQICRHKHPQRSWRTIPLHPLVLLFVSWSISGNYLGARKKNVTNFVHIRPSPTNLGRIDFGPFWQKLTLVCHEKVWSCPLIQCNNIVTLHNRPPCYFQMQLFA